MNIFYLSSDPETAAQMACDKHVIKMILETAQLLYTAQHLSDNNLYDCPYQPYKVAHKNHPSAIWARSSMDQYNWLCQLGLAYCDEYKFRYGYDKEHSSHKHLIWLYNNPPVLDYNGFIEPPQCMPEQYKDYDDCIQAYRNYYIGEKLPFAKYTVREVPYWLEDYF
jgi:hypothetical protein